MKKILNIIFLAGICASFSAVPMTRRRAIRAQDRRENEFRWRMRITEITCAGASVAALCTAAGLWYTVANRADDHGMCNSIPAGIDLYSDGTTELLDCCCKACSAIGCVTMGITWQSAFDYRNYK